MVRRMNEVYPRAISLADRGAVDLGSVVTSRSGLGEIPEAFGDAARRTGLKAIIEPQRRPLRYAHAFGAARGDPRLLLRAAVRDHRPGQPHQGREPGRASPSTAWPFLAGLAGGWLAARAWRRPSGTPLPAGVGAWLGTAALGMVFRVVSGQGTAVAFVLVALAFLGLFLLYGWRLAIRLGGSTGQGFRLGGSLARPPGADSGPVVQR